MKVTEKMMGAAASVVDQDGRYYVGDDALIGKAIEAALAAVEVTPEMLKAYDSAWPGYPASKAALEAVFHADV